MHSQASKTLLDNKFFKSFYPLNKYKDVYFIPYMCVCASACMRAVRVVRAFMYACMHIIYIGLFKSRQPAKITPFYNRFAGCMVSSVCIYTFTV